MKLPNRLYKYRAFSDRTLGNLIEDKLYFAVPSTFNDPLDAKPGLELDVGDVELETMLVKLIEQRVQSELNSAARTIRYKGPKCHCSLINQKRA